MAFSPKSFNLPLQAGQTIILGFEGTALSSSLRSALKTIRPAGVILFARNILEPGQTWELLRECQICSATPMFLCVDMEGGAVDRLRSVFAPAPAAAEVAATGNRRFFREHGRIIGRECRALGFNTDFAPVLDLALEPSRRVLGSRAVSADPESTVTYAREFLHGLHDARVLGCGKHYPGLGSARLDTHASLALVEKPRREMWKADLYPYRALCRSLHFVMVAHAAYPLVTPAEEPASISRKWIVETLRKRIGYRGLVVSDDLEMGGMQCVLPVPEAAVAAIMAGNDVALICHQIELALAAHEGIARRAERDWRFARRLQEAAHRVLEHKRKWAELKSPPPAPNTATMKKLRREIVDFRTKISDLRSMECRTSSRDRERL